MTSPTDSPPILLIQEQAKFDLETIPVEVESYLGQFADVHYFRVKIHSSKNQPDSIEENLAKQGLLRVGSVEGELSRELKLRQILGSHRMVCDLLVSITQPSVSLVLSPPAFRVPLEQDSLAEALSDITTADEEASRNQLEESSEYLEDEFLPEILLVEEIPGEKLILLGELPKEEETLEAWLSQEHSLEQSLLVVSQICQLFRYVLQQGWCFFKLNPRFIQKSTGEKDTLIKFFDLTGAHTLGAKLDSGLVADYCAPELAYGHPIDEQMSTYIVGALLYQLTHQQLPSHESYELKFKPIPRIYQLLKISLGNLGERFSLSQLLSLLVETRQSFRNPKIRWEVASRSTVGLSLSRLQNEDNFGVRQQTLSNSDSFILGVVADGMGGMAEGEVASKLAVKTLIEATIPEDLKKPEKRSEWLLSLVDAANECVTNHVREGGTTLSAVLAVGKELAIAHVGDSRIFLLRKNQLCQLSEDHSMVAMLLASGQIDYAESLDHPDQNVLTKSIGSKKRLSNGYVQDLSRFESGSSFTLEHGDTLILCSDGVWDLVPTDNSETANLANFFSNHQPLQLSVDQVIEQVLKQGAHDNSTVLALRCFLDSSY